MTNTQQTLQNIKEYFEQTLFANYEINGIPLKVYSNFLPVKTLENQDNSVFPFILLRYYKNKQKLENPGVYETFYSIEALVGVDCGKINDLTIEYNDEIMEMIRKDFMETPIKSGKFAVSQSQILCEIDYEAMYEAQKSSYCYSIVKFDVRGLDYNPTMAEKL